MATSVLKNDQPAPGGATTPAANVKSETEHSQSKETPGDRPESSGTASMIYCTFSQFSSFLIYLMPVFFFVFCFPISTYTDKGSEHKRLQGWSLMHHPVSDHAV